MSALVITLFRLGFLVLLWLFIFFILLTIKNDVYGTRVTQRGSARPVAKQSKRSLTPTRKPQLASASRPYIVVSGGSLTGSTIPLGTDSVTVGRSPDSALVLDDGYTSARHARFFNQGGQWFVEDLDSTNGTWVGTERIYEPTRLGFGVPVTIGKTTLELRQ
ncbi:FHA domain-containing protein [Trueperella pyogenes]|uniref:FHA domain-containing protein n=1 Tax=Trueperella pyogenes TaxID=1661 RepID=A0ABV3NCH2_9ACTO|nr:FHA domain-containing protein [Trueperella pyogenes]AHU89867.1 signal peptide protein [Trueperella pyogenes]AJC70333.1 signal peptide protein [Trueperella pyogenes TP8]ALD73432.1 hypothetical protein AN946_02715 [Trueperella pyogenes]AWA43893.1 FHA domain-containing protein [Trueperella pyogenes]AZR01350.1 FHA domain-containing protein [Trueperella pyogenes]